VPDAPGAPSAEELSVLPAAELAARLAEAYRLIGELTVRNERLAARVEDLERRCVGIRRCRRGRRRRTAAALAPFAIFILWRGRDKRSGSSS
jgi:hypothetical protein